MFKRKFMQIFVKKNQQKEEITEKTGKLLKSFYNSFFSDIFNEMNIDRYRPIRDATGMVINKFTANDTHWPTRASWSSLSRPTWP